MLCGARDSHFSIGKENPSEIGKKIVEVNIQRVSAQPHHLHFTRTTVMLTLSNQAKIWCEACYYLNLILNKEISAHVEQ